MRGPDWNCSVAEGGVSPHTVLPVTPPFLTQLLAFEGKNNYICLTRWGTSVNGSSGFMSSLVLRFPPSQELLPVPSLPNETKLLLIGSCLIPSPKQFSLVSQKPWGKHTYNIILWAVWIFRNIPCHYSSSANRCQKLNCRKYNIVCQRNCTVQAAGLHNIPAMMERRCPEHYLWVIIYTPDITAIYTLLDETQRSFLSISVPLATGACSQSTCSMANNAAS